VNIAVLVGIHDYEQGDYAGARQLQEQVLAASRRLLGEEPPRTLGAMSNLARPLIDQGDLAGARQLHERMLEICRRVLGAEHPITLRAMNNVGRTSNAQGDLAGKRQLYEQVLEDRRRVVGKEHQNTSTAAWNLSQTLLESGNVDEAREIVAENLQWLVERDPATLPLKPAADPPVADRHAQRFWLGLSRATNDESGKE
jgi:tetratricopeptide (TPR) repeat protein